MFQQRWNCSARYVVFMYTLLAGNYSMAKGNDFPIDAIAKYPKMAPKVTPDMTSRSILGLRTYVIALLEKGIRCVKWIWQEVSWIWHQAHLLLPRRGWSNSHMASNVVIAHRCATRKLCKRLTRFTHGQTLR